MSIMKHLKFKQFKTWLFNQVGCHRLDNNILDECFRIIDAVDDEWFFLRERQWNKKFEQHVLMDIINPIEEINNKQERV